MMARALVIGIGNPLRSDDGAGLAALRCLRRNPPQDVLLVEESGEGAALMSAWKGADRVILIDAVHSGAEPGAIHRFDAARASLPRGLFHLSSHAFGVADAVELARALGELPPVLILYGIECENFSAGSELSPKVKVAVEQVAERIAGELHIGNASLPGN